MRLGRCARSTTWMCYFAFASAKESSRKSPLGSPERLRFELPRLGRPARYNAIARADALNGFAWILATWGLQLSALNAQPLKSSLPNGSLWTPGASPDCKQDGSTDTSNALGAVKVAICILTGEKQNLGEASYKEKLANYTDTYAYLLMQLGQAESAVEVLKPLDIKDDTATQFRYAAAAFSLGKEYEKVGLSVLKSSLSNQDQPYIPSHEVYQLRRLIAGEFYKELYSSIDKAHPQKESHCPN